MGVKDLIQKLPKVNVSVQRRDKSADENELFTISLAGEEGFGEEDFVYVEMDRESADMYRRNDE